MEELEQKANNNQSKNENYPFYNNAYFWRMTAGAIVGGIGFPLCMNYFTNTPDSVYSILSISTGGYIVDGLVGALAGIMTFTSDGT